MLALHTIPDSMKRMIRLIRNAIEAFGLDLRGQKVLTEAATGFFSVTPAIALMAGAERVMCLTRNSRYGSFEQAKEQVSSLVRSAGLCRSADVFSDRVHCPVEEADIVTNLGFVRPLDRAFVGRMKPGSVISLMWEPWEFRPAEIDLAACRDRQVLVLGTDEQDHRLQTFRYLGLTVMKLLSGLDLEILGNTFVLLSDCPFGVGVSEVLSANGANVRGLSTTTWFSLAPDTIATLFDGADALVFLVHSTDRPLLNTRESPSLEAILAAAPDLKIVHISGNLESSFLRDANVPHSPGCFAPPFFMSTNTAYLGPKPVVDLHTAGLHVASAYLRMKSGSQHEEEAIARAKQFAPLLGPVR